MEVTIGGNRLGSGKKMKQELHNYERSNHDLNKIWRSTMSPGTLVPFYSKLLLPGDTMDIELNAQVLTNPTVGPLFGSFKLQLDMFMCPVRLYQAQLHNNKLGIGKDMAKIKLPIFEIQAKSVNFNSKEPLDLQQINPSSLLNYLGLKGLGHGETPTQVLTKKKCALKVFAYYDIYKNTNLGEIISRLFFHKSKRNE